MAVYSLPFTLFTLCHLQETLGEWMDNTVVKGPRYKNRCPSKKKKLRKF